MYTILNIQYIQIFNFVHSRNTIFKQCTQFCIQNEFFFSSILYIQCTKIFNYCTQSCTFIVCKFTKNVQNSIFSNYRIFQRMYILFVFNIYNFSINEINYVYLMYTNFQLCTFNMLNFLNIYTILYIKYT